jgi:putative transposase
MAWKVSCVMDERVKFVGEALKEERCVRAICREFGISPKTGHKWLARYREEGLDGLRDRSRAPHTCPRAIDAHTREMVVAFKRRHMDLGPKKVRACLQRRYPEQAWPAPSTIGAWLKEAGLVVARQRVRRATPSTQPLAHADGPNAVWCADFKGWFETGDGRRCTPLTISDAYSRYLLRCQGLGGQTGLATVQPLFDAAFREFGLPLAIRTDNGPPFASVGLGGLSHLSVWWMRLGIYPERIQPGHPEQNGRHERMHRTLNEGAIDPPANNLRAQQNAFNRFTRYYNDERPHEALEQRPPAALYTASPRAYPARLLPTDDYPANWAIRKVKNGGRIKWNGHELHVATPLTSHYVGLKPVDNGRWLLYFMQTPIALFDEKDVRMRKLTPSIKTRYLFDGGPGAAIEDQTEALPMSPV